MTSDGDVLFDGQALRYDVAPSKTRNPKVLFPIFDRSMIQKNEVSKFFSSSSAHT